MFSNIRHTLANGLRVVDKTANSAVTTVDAVTDVIDGAAVYAKAWKGRVIQDNHYDEQEYREIARMNAAVKSAERRAELKERLNQNPLLKEEYKLAYDRVASREELLDQKLAAL
jgi:hypothetical protein